MSETKSKKEHRLPIPGQRIIRSMFAAWICMLIYDLRGRDGIVFLAVIASLQCIQPFAENTLQMGKKRIIGTLVGAVWGTTVLYLEFFAVGNAGLEQMLHFLLMGAVAGAVMYSTVLLKIPDSAYFSAVVFLSIAMNHVTDAAPILYVIDRVIDTTVGVLVGIAVNSLQLPRLKNKDILFVSGIDQVASEKGHQMAPYTVFELNRLIREGARFSVITKQTPSMIRELMGNIRLKYPVIAMDGAALYDMEERKYLCTEVLDKQTGRKVCDYLDGRNAHYFINTIEDQLLASFYHEMGEGPMKELYMKRRTNPYRNFVRTDREITENILHFTIVGTPDEVHDIRDDLLLQPFSDEVRTDFSTYECPEGVQILRVYSALASKEKMIRKLKEYVSAEKVVKFGIEESWADTCFPYAGDEMVRELKKEFEPVSLKGWRNMIRV